MSKVTTLLKEVESKVSSKVSNLIRGVQSEAKSEILKLLSEAKSEAHSKFSDLINEAKLDGKLEVAKFLTEAKSKISDLESELEVSKLLLNVMLLGFRLGTPKEVTYPDGLPELDFSEPKQQSHLFYPVKGEEGLEINIAYGILQSIPIPENPSGGEPVQEDFYSPLIGNMDYPAHYQESTSPLDCFLKNAPALCKHTGDNSAELDLNYLADYPVRSGFLAYGGKATLSIKDGEYKLEGVENENASSPEEAKNIFLSSFSVHVIFARHAVMTHLAIAQRLLIKFTLPGEEEEVNNNTRLKSLLQVLTTRVNEVSSRELLLIGKSTLVARAASFTNEGLIDAGTDIYEEYSKLSPTELVSLLGEGSVKWKAAVNSGWEAAQKLINDLKLNISESDMQLLALDVWGSSFYHQFIGDLQLDNLIKGNLPFPCTGQIHLQNESYATIATTIAVTTMTRMYSVEDVPAIIRKADASDTISINAWEEYANTLNSLDTGIDQFPGTGACAAVNF